MSSNITDSSDPKKSASSSGDNTNVNASPSSKGKKKRDEKMEEDEEEEEDDTDDEEEESEAEEDSLEEIDPSAIVPQGRRTRGVRVDYTSKEALEKAGLQANEDEESDEDVEMKA